MTLSERQIKKVLEEQGWTVYAKGWPDFLCLKINADGKWEVS